MSLPKYFDNEYLIRFLKGRDWDLTDALEMFELFVEWRKEKNVESIHVNNINKSQIFINIFIVIVIIIFRK